VKRLQEQLSCCALCQDVLKDPVSTSCGHWFCRQCISAYWDQSASSGDSSCPQCGERARGRLQTANQSSCCRSSLWTGQRAWRTNMSVWWFCFHSGS
uniref:RING-type domain-containing protein n=1 Tax=Oreochromis niloticus TaxID=8128 RepID=A0A669E6W1_ORENI